MSHALCSRAFTDVGVSFYCTAAAFFLDESPARTKLGHLNFSRAKIYLVYRRLRGRQVALPVHQAGSTSRRNAKCEAGMAKLKSERHHWWPRCVSRHWVDADGTTGWITNTGEVRRLRPDALGQIRDGHHIKLSRTPGEPDHWDSSFEHEFNAADNTFPDTIQWLESLECEEQPDQPLRNRFIAQSASDDQLRLLTEAVVSLAVRSPRFRERCVALAELLRGPLPEPERNALIGANMRHAQRSVSDALGIRAKYAVLFTREREFIFGDGFFQNISGTAPQYTRVSMLAPITPTMSVIIFQPSRYQLEPRISTIVLTEAEVAACNDAVQVYSGRDLFFRSQRPTLLADFMSGKHMEYASSDNPIRQLMDSLPGVSPRRTLASFLN